MTWLRIGALISAVVFASGLAACAPGRSAGGPNGATGASASPPASASSAAAGDSPSIPAGSPIEPAAELAVECDGTTTDIPSPAVRARADGVHVRFSNTSGKTLDFGIDEAAGLPLLGDSVAPEGAAFVYTLGTGGYRLGCGGPQTAFEVVDPDRQYTPVDLACPTSGTTATSDYGEDARGPKGTVLDIARMELFGLMPGDVVERAGYPASDGDQLVRVVRNGQVVAVIAYADDGHGGWLVGTTRTCPGSRINVGAP
jgi:hypothetical protein